MYKKAVINAVVSVFTGNDIRTILLVSADTDNGVCEWLYTFFVPLINLSCLFQYRICLKAQQLPTVRI